jgi:NAD-dependent SIR2 family protein deacetylase
LRPDILLYEEANPFEDQIFARLEEDRQGCPDLVIVVGTRLSIPGARGIAKDLCDHALKSGGKTAWVNKNRKLRGLEFSLVWEGDCDDLATSTF